MERGNRLSLTDVSGCDGATRSAVFCASFFPMKIWDACQVDNCLDRPQNVLFEPPKAARNFPQQSPQDLRADFITQEQLTP